MRSLLGPIGMHLMLAEIFGVVPQGGLNLPRLIETHVDILYNGLVADGARDR